MANMDDEVMDLMQSQQEMMLDTAEAIFELADVLDVDLQTTSVGEMIRMAIRLIESDDDAE